MEMVLAEAAHPPSPLCVFSRACACVSPCRARVSLEAAKMCSNNVDAYSVLASYSTPPAHQTEAFGALPKCWLVQMQAQVLMQMLNRLTWWVVVQEVETHKGCVMGLGQAIQNGRRGVCGPHAHTLGPSRRLP